MRYILALTKRARVNGNDEGSGHEFEANEASKRNLVDGLKIARVVSTIDDSGRVAAPKVAQVQTANLDDLKYNELRELAEKLGVSRKGKTEEIRERIRSHKV